MVIGSTVTARVAIMINVIDKKSKYYIQKKPSVDRVILPSFIESISLSELISSSQRTKEGHK